MAATFDDLPLVAKDGVRRILRVRKARDSTHEDDVHTRGRRPFIASILRRESLDVQPDSHAHGVVSKPDVLRDQGHPRLKREPTNELVPLQGQDRSGGGAAASSIRVAHVGNYNPDSADGTEKTIAGFVKWLPRYGVDVEVWQPDPRALTVRERERDGVRIFDLPAYRWPSNFLHGLAGQTRAFVLERQRAVDLVHFHSAFIP